MPALESMSDALMLSEESRPSLPLVLLLCLFQDEAVETLPFLSVTRTWDSPVETLVTLKATCRDALVSSAIFTISRSLRTTWSKNSRGLSYLSPATSTPSALTWKVRGVPSVSR